MRVLFSPLPTPIHPMLQRADPQAAANPNLTSVTEELGLLHLSTPSTILLEDEDVCGYLWAGEWGEC